MQQLPTPRELVALNSKLPDALRDRSVVLQFVKPVPVRNTEHFYRIRLTGQMLAGGEDDFFTPELVQPHRTGRQVCLKCGSDMRRISLTLYQCESLRCRVFGNGPSYAGPTRGVVSVRTEFEAHFSGRPSKISFLAGLERKTIDGMPQAVPIVNGCLLMLDRRYRIEVLAAVYRTAGVLCEQLRAGGVDIGIK